MSIGWTMATNFSMTAQPETRLRQDKDLQLTQAEYMRFRDLIVEKIGLDFSEDKRRILGRGLAETLGTTDCTSLEEFYALLQSSSVTSHVWDQLVGILTVGETYFFRHLGHFDALATHILPEIIAQREHSGRRIRIWSAGCATGEEPYSVAILLKELIPDLESWRISILATDINRDALRKAQEGLYGAWSFRSVEKRVQDTYFRPSGDKQFAITDTIKRMVTFDYLNLVGDPYPALTNNTNAMDVILCRNVTIYFKPDVTQKVLAYFHNCLTEGGWLIPGAAEPNLVSYKEFDPRNFPGAVVYQKRVQAVPEARPTYRFLPEPPTFTPLLPVIEAHPPEPPQAATAQIEKKAPSSRSSDKDHRKEPSPLPDAFQMALELLLAGEADAALVKLQEKLDQDADFVPAYYTVGKVYANKGHLEQAQHWCEKAIQKDKLHPEPYYTLSMIYQQHGVLDMAVDTLKKAIYLERGFVLAHYNLAQLYLRQGEKASARKSLENVHRLLEGKPKDEPIPEGDGLVVGRLLELVEEQLAQEA
jgi:chemotaxis protein methyltransferase CheR